MAFRGRRCLTPVTLQRDKTTRIVAPFENVCWQTFLRTVPFRYGPPVLSDSFPSQKAALRPDTQSFSFEATAAAAGALEPGNVSVRPNQWHASRVQKVARLRARSVFRRGVLRSARAKPGRAEKPASRSLRSFFCVQVHLPFELL